MRLIELVVDIEDGDHRIFSEEFQRYVLSQRFLSSKEWPETGQSAYKLIRSKGEAATPR